MAKKKKRLADKFRDIELEKDDSLKVLENAMTYLLYDFQENTGLEVKSVEFKGSIRTHPEITVFVGVPDKETLTNDDYIGEEE